MVSLPDPRGAAALPAYAELHCRSNFSFGCGASQPQELVARAHALGYAALALTDECSVAGVVRAHQEAQERGLRFLPGAEFVVPHELPTSDGLAGEIRFSLLVLPRDLVAWGELCVFITAARRAAPKGQYRVRWPDPAWAALKGCEVILVLPRTLASVAAGTLVRSVAAVFAPHLWLAVHLPLGPADAAWLAQLNQLSQRTDVPLLATGNVVMHVRSRKPLQDVLTAIRLGQPLPRCGLVLQANAEAHLRTRERLAQIYPPQLLANTLAVVERCRFRLDALRYQYPLEAVLPGLTPLQTLSRFVHDGASHRYPLGVPPAVSAQLAHELDLIAELQYEMYFLTVHDIVAFARSKGILCQGRGSAANSAVCYCLRITEVDPARSQLLFERFISRERGEPPDIDVDFEHQRREEVIQYIYAKYGRDRAALSAVVISYRPRSALRDVGRALGIDAALIGAMAREHPGMYSREVLAERLQAALQRLGPHHAAPASRMLELWLDLSRQLMGFPRHLSQHPGGFVLTRGPLTRLVPVENAAMPGRSIIQWDKDDLDAMGLLKVDVLALGMLSAIRRCLDLVSQRRGQRFGMQDIPADDPATFDMVCAADTVGVFQIESRAQMSMLPRLKPRCFYDLVVEVAIVRPGPIQGGMVHPYLMARVQPDAVSYASPALKDVLQRTLGVPIFQEQVMQVAMAAADFSPGEADQLRRSMAAWRRRGGVHVFYDRLVGGMLKNGYSRDFADRLFRQIEGFGEYGFPESHAASFALLVWISSWLKRHEPACFLAALLNSQPMGFYGPAQLVQDARRHGVRVWPVDVLHSHWDCTLEGVADPDPPDTATKAAIADAQPAVRLGLRLVTGLNAATAQRIVAARLQARFSSTDDLARRAELDQGELQLLAGADALLGLAGHRRQQVWSAAGSRRAPALLHDAPIHENTLLLPQASAAEEVHVDYASVGLSLRAHPVQLLRPRLSELKLLTATQLRNMPHGSLVRSCGLVTARQSPYTARGVTFVTLEDETGSTNVIVWKSLKEKQRAAVMHSRLLVVHGVWQRDVDSGGQVCHVLAGYLRDLTPWLKGLAVHSRDFH